MTLPNASRVSNVSASHQPPSFPARRLDRGETAGGEVPGAVRNAIAKRQQSLASAKPRHVGRESGTGTSLAAPAWANRAGAVFRVAAMLVTLAVVTAASAEKPKAKAERIGNGGAAAAINESALRGHIRFLADDLLEGRGPGTRGDALTQLYLASQFQSLGLQPAADEGRWRQPVPLVGIKTQCPETISFRGGSQPVELDYYDDYIATAGRPQETTRVDDASGTAALLTVARAFAELLEPPRRSILFAAVGGEESGLLGSKHFAADPPIAPGNMAAVINIDGVNIIGPTHDVNMIGMGKSTLDDVVRDVAESQGRIVTPDQFPDRGYYYRSDQFSLARIGVPGVYLHSGVHVVGKPDEWGRRQLERWIDETYHQPSDEYDPEWNLDGALQDIRLLYRVGRRLAEKDELPAWNPGDEFEASRKQALRAARGGQ